MPSGTSLGLHLSRFLAVAILRAFAHGARLSHAAVSLKRAALKKDELRPGASSACRRKATNHYDISTCGDGLGHVTRKLTPPSELQARRIARRFTQD